MRPLIPEGVGTVAHLWWRGGVTRDTRANAWATAGTLPQVGAAARTPAGAGPFSDANYLSLGTGNDALDFAGDFSICVVFKPPAVVANQMFTSNGLHGTDGYYFQTVVTTGVISFVTSAAAGAYTATPTVNAVVAGALNVACAGRAGATQYVKLNLGSIASGEARNVPATTRAAYVGRYVNATWGFGGTLYEVWFSTAAPSDALFAYVAQTVKTRARIAAW